MWRGACARFASAPAAFWAVCSGISRRRFIRYSSQIHCSSNVCCMIVVRCLAILLATDEQQCFDSISKLRVRDLYYIILYCITCVLIMCINIYIYIYICKAGEMVEAISDDDGEWYLGIIQTAPPAEHRKAD